MVLCYSIWIILLWKIIWLFFSIVGGLGLATGKRVERVEGNVFMI